MTKKTKQNKKRTKELITLIILLLIPLLLTLKISWAMPQIQLISQTNPLEYTGIQTITLNITSNTNNTTIAQAFIEFDGQNHTVEGEGSVYAYSWVPLNKGTNTYKIYATDSLNETQNYTNIFVVQDTTPPEIIETQPQGLLDYNLIELKAITNENCTCKYDEVDVSYDSMTFGLSGEGEEHTKLRMFGDGEHTLYVRCKDFEDNIGQSQAINFTIDTSSPGISGIKPTGTLTQEQITLSFNTNEIATCRWDKTNQDYDSLYNQFQTTGATLHEQPLTLIQGINTYYVSCKDLLGNYNDPPITINIELNFPPTISIDIHRNSSYKALRQGTYEVNLLASEPLSQAPSLKLRYSNKQINIPLEGSSENWEGYLIIPENSGEHAAEFLYQGKDAKGMTGTEITSGKLVLVDTNPPSEPRSLRLFNENNKIKLSWDYEGEKTHHFNIYRSTTGKTDKSDFKTITEVNPYQDADVINKIGYFYRLSAVDQAGNEGLLSEEKFIMTEFQNASPGFKQEPELLLIINNKINQLERKVQDLEVKIAELEATTDSDLLHIINEQELVSKLREIKSQIRTLIGELKTYRETKLSKEELDTKAEIIDAKIEEYEKDIIKEVRVRNKIQNEQVTEENLLQRAIEEYFKNKALTKEQKTEYYTRTKKLQEEIRILQEIISYEIEYEYKEDERITLIRETILLPEGLEGVLIQEIIPKDVIKISEITFRNTPAELNAIGALWFLRDLENSEIKYTTFNKKDLNQLQTIKTILLYDIDEFLNTLSEENLTSSSQITGEAVAGEDKEFALTKFVLIPLGIIILIGLLIYYFIFLKTEHGYEKEIMTRIDKQEKEALEKAKIPGKKSALIFNEKTMVSDSKSGLDTLFVFIQRAYEGLERNDIRAAYEQYSLALLFYNRINLRLKDRLKANLEMNTLSEEIKKTVEAKHLYT
ncbi:hypothetical protein KY348_03580 [Candidatus Woesearchaeota archaeon]|nr:hypothetical protein [Candidatus Woesearchaeota archaeon]